MNAIESASDPKIVLLKSELMGCPLLIRSGRWGMLVVETLIHRANRILLQNAGRVAFSLIHLEARLPRECAR
jgi:hypothetical protein